MRYRIYDKEEKKYRSESYYLTCNGNLVFDHDGIRHVPREAKEEFIIEQSTGLKDVNGREIYVGDVVYLEDIDKKGVLSIQTNITMELWFTSFDGMYHIDFGHFDTTNIVILGNIHQEEYKHLRSEE